MKKEAEEVIRMMNQAGAEGSPFVFGLDFELCRGFFIPNPFEQQEVLFDFHGFSNCRPRATTSSSYRFNKYPETQAEYARRFSIIREGLLRGDSFLTNLTVQTPIETDLSPEEIFHRSDTLYKVYVPGTFVCFSPERFVKIEKSVISSNPMKGTIDAHIPDAETKILSDYKELSEHYTIVDLIRNDLSMVASLVRVERFRYIDRIETSKHASTFHIQLLLLLYFSYPASIIKLYTLYLNFDYIGKHKAYSFNLHVTTPIKTVVKYENL